MDLSIRAEAVGHTDGRSTLSGDRVGMNKNLSLWSYRRGGEEMEKRRKHQKWNWFRHWSCIGSHPISLISNPNLKLMPNTGIVPAFKEENLDKVRSNTIRSLETSIGPEITWGNGGTTDSARIVIWRCSFRVAGRPLTSFATDDLAPFLLSSPLE